jgi:pilus assembly protein CpaC
LRKPIFFLFIVLTLAQLSFLPRQLCSEEAEINLLLGELKVFPVDSPKRIAVGDPAIADVSIISNKEIMLMAKSVGSTSLIIWDKSDRSFSYTVHVAGKDMTATVRQLENILEVLNFKDVTVRPQVDRIFLMGNVSSPEELKHLQEAISPFKADVVNLVSVKERKQMVQIEAEVLEVTKEDTLKLGLTWGGDTSGTGIVEIGSQLPTSPVGNLPGVFLSSWTREQLNATINSLITDNKAKTLSSPRVVAVSGKEANILVGGEIPVVTTTAVGGGTTTNVEYKPYGISLKIKPTVQDEDEIKTTLRAEVSEIDNVNAVVVEGISIPALKTRTAETEVVLKSGFSLVIGGLIKNEESKNISRVPFLSKVPILGELFKSRDFSEGKTDLVITITPTIIKEQPKAQEEKVTAASPTSTYARSIQETIARAIRYPEGLEGFEGQVKIRMYLLSDGTLEDAVVLESSGIQALDSAILRIVKLLSPYPPFPSQIKKRRLQLDLPVIYQAR